MEKLCLNCNQQIEGRKGKKYCNSYCKSNYHYEHNKKNLPSFYIKVDKQLKLNRKLLKRFNKSGKSYVIAKELNDQGFDKNFFTHYWKNSKGEVYLFCYEYGFLLTQANYKSKYLLVTWQPYMDKSHK